MQNLTEVQTIEYRCHNCGFLFSKVFPLHTSPVGQGGVCPSCKFIDGSLIERNFSYQVILKNAQILME
jgi:hypothetical protein